MYDGTLTSCLRTLVKKKLDKRLHNKFKSLFYYIQAGQEKRREENHQQSDIVVTFNHNFKVQVKGHIYRTERQQEKSSILLHL